MTHFRKRLGADAVNKVNEWIVMEGAKDDSQNTDDPGDGNAPIDSSHSSDETKSTPTKPKSNQGKLLLDATCAAADIAYPTDFSLLNEAREKLEQMIDVIHAPYRGSLPKPRTYREKARRAYLAIAKQRRVNFRMLRKAIGQQLRYVARNLRTMARLNDQGGLTALSKQQYKQLLVIHELYRQQREMYVKREHRIDDRIVSISQPHVRPIVRGKAKANVEFGAKVAISLVDGYALMEKLDWDSYNEGVTLQGSVEAYYERYGCYPEAVLADKIYRNRENLRYCKENGIRLSGPALVDQRRKSRRNTGDLNDRMPPNATR